jgi:hypothetical protein
MWGADQDTEGHDCSVGTGQVHVDCAARIADQALGVMLDQLELLGQLDETLIVLTADHGATHAESFQGTYAAGASNTNWYYGSTANGSFLSPSTSLAALIGTGNVQFSYQSTAIETWLVDRSDAELQEASSVMLTLPGVIASYWRAGDHYVLAGSNQMPKSERQWWKKHGQELVDSMAADNGPDVIGLLHDATSYGVQGDHGGAQEEVQRVPMVFWREDRDRGKGVYNQFRSVDVLPTILRALGIDLVYPVDGTAKSV